MGECFLLLNPNASYKLITGEKYEQRN